MKQWWTVPGVEGGVSELRDVDRPKPGPSQVLVEVRGAAINRGELLTRPLMKSANPMARPARSGIEFTGEIVEVGTEVLDWSVGDRVMGRGTGCHSEFVVIESVALMAVPDDMSFEDAAAIPNVFVTAHDAMVTAAAQSEGDAVLITAGSSGVGTAAIQIAKKLSAAHVIATTRSQAKAEALRDLGATLVVDTTQSGWVEEIRSATGGIDVVIDQVGGELFGPCLMTMSIEGRYVTVGRNGGRQAAIDLDLVARQRLSVIGVTFRTRSPEEAIACSTRFAGDLLPFFADGSLRPVLDRTFPLEDLPAAHDYMSADQHVGKVVLVT